MAEGTPVRISHRGGGSLAPENSLEGIERAIALGVDMVEIDVRRTADGALVLGHDDYVNGARISATPLSALRDGPSGPGIVTLDAALDAVRGRVRLNLDVKDTRIAGELVDTVRARGLLDGCIVTCLSARCLVALRAIEPELRAFLSYPPDYGGASRRWWMTPAVDAAAMLMRWRLPGRLPGMLRSLPGCGAAIWYRAVSPPLVLRAHDMGVGLYTWAVDDEAEIRRLVAMGVDGITSNRPDVLCSIGDVERGTRN